MQQSLHPMFPRPISPSLTLRQMRTTDLGRVCEIQHQCYSSDFHEPEAAFASKLRQSPSSCWVACDEGDLPMAYLVSLPVSPGHYPALHADDWMPPARPTTLYMHDMAVMPALKGQGVAVQLFTAAHQYTIRSGLSDITLIAVQGSVPYWQRHGFAVVPPEEMDEAMRKKLASFGPDARFMRQVI